jgi:hypothetical protein
LVHKQQIAVVLVFLVCICCVQVVNARLPLPEERAQNCVPHVEGAPLTFLSDGQFIALDFHQRVYPYTETAMPYFPELSEYWASSNLTYVKTGDRYIAQVWYFNNWSKFSTEREKLFLYLHQQGTLTPAVLDVSPELIASNNSYLAGYKTRIVNVTKYQSNETSGYFIIFNTDFFYDESYYITYYGVTGSSDLMEETHPLKMLIISGILGLPENSHYEFDPTIPHPVPIRTPLPPILPVAALCIIMVVGLNMRRN